MVDQPKDYIGINIHANKHEEKTRDFATNKEARDAAREDTKALKEATAHFNTLMKAYYDGKPEGTLDVHISNPHEPSLLSFLTSEGTGIPVLVSAIANSNRRHVKEDYKGKKEFDVDVRGNEGNGYAVHFGVTHKNMEVMTEGVKKMTEELENAHHYGQKLNLGKLNEIYLNYVASNVEGPKTAIAANTDVQGDPVSGLAANNVKPVGKSGPSHS